MADINVYSEALVGESVTVTPDRQINVYEAVALTEYVEHSTPIRVDSRPSKALKLPTASVKIKVGDRMSLAALAPTASIATQVGSQVSGKGPTASIVTGMAPTWYDEFSLAENAPVAVLASRGGSEVSGKFPTPSLAAVTYSPYMAVSGYMPLASLAGAATEEIVFETSGNAPTPSAAITMYCTSITLNKKSPLWIFSGSFIANAFTTVDSNAPVAKANFDAINLYDVSIQVDVTSPVALGNLNEGSPGTVREEGYFSDYILQYRRWA